MSRDPFDAAMAVVAVVVLAGAIAAALAGVVAIVDNASQPHEAPCQGRGR